MTAIKKNLEEIADAVIRACAKLEAETREALEQLKNDETTKPDVLNARRAEIIKGVETGYSRIRQEYGRKVDELANALRRIGGTIKPKPSADDAAAAQILSVLQVSPLCTQQMLDSAAKSVGGSQFAQDTLRQIAQRHGLIIHPMQPIDRHVDSGTFYKLADDVSSTFRAFFDARQEYLDPDGKADISQYEGRKTALDWAHRSNSEASMRNISSLFAFDGDSNMQAEYAAAENAAE